MFAIKFLMLLTSLSCFAGENSSIYQITDPASRPIMEKGSTKERIRSEPLAKRHQEIYPLLICAVEMIEGRYSNNEPFNTGVAFLKFLRDKNLSDIKNVTSRCKSLLKKYKKNRNIKSEVAEVSDDFTKKLKNIRSGCDINYLRRLGVRFGAMISIGFDILFLKKRSHLGLAQKATTWVDKSGIGFGAAIIFPTKYRNGSCGFSSPAQKYKKAPQEITFIFFTLDEDCDEPMLSLGFHNHIAIRTELDYDNINWVTGKNKDHDFYALLKFLGYEFEPAAAALISNNKES